MDDDDPRRRPGDGERTVRGTTGGPCREGANFDLIFVREHRIVAGGPSTPLERLTMSRQVAMLSCGASGDRTGAPKGKV